MNKYTVHFGKCYPMWLDGYDKTYHRKRTYVDKNKALKCLIKRVDDIFKYRHEVTNSWDSDEYLEVLEGYDSFDESE